MADFYCFEGNDSKRLRDSLPSSLNYGVEKLMCVYKSILLGGKVSGKYLDNRIECAYRRTPFTEYRRLPEIKMK